ncbi:hypothetical protein CE91St41_04590 [Oscillospiraceae bacterium]|nr:hypothetical protein CE91St41_04590 [Oscillospiraceae bacterium]
MQLSQIRSCELELLDIKCKSVGETRVLPRLMYRIAREQVAASNLTMAQYFPNCGWASMDGFPVYVAGNRVITASGWADPSRYSLSPSLTDLTLEVDDTINKADAARYVRNLCRLHPGVSDILVASAVAGHLFSLFVEAGVTPRLIMYIVGPSMMKKTTLATLIGGTYNPTSDNCPHLVNLLSSTAAVHQKVSAFSDCCIILDDLNASESKAEMRRREERLGEVIRTAGNVASKEKMAGKSTALALPRGIVFVTAEYTLRAYSTMARCVVLHLDDPVRNEVLTPLQRRPKALSTFWFFFLRWCCQNYMKILDYIRNNYHRHRSEGAVHPGMERLDDAYFVLTVAMDILECYQKVIAPGRVSTIGRITDNFYHHLDCNLEQQVQELRQLQASTDSDRFSKMLAKLFYGRKLDLQKKKHLGPDCNGAQDKDKRMLYLSLEYLTGKARQYFRDTSITRQAITAELRRNGLLEMDRSRRSTKKVGNARFLHIPLDRLQAYYGTPLCQPGSHELWDIMHPDEHV